jgi:catalase
MIRPERAVDAINARFGRHQARALHAKGTLCKGRFTATPDGGRLTRAGHMQGEPVEATVRFSNGSGDPASGDNELDVRGMAVKLYLADGSRTDISAQTVSRFPVRTPDAFVALVRANDPGVARFWRMPLFLATHPDAISALRAGAAGLKPPVSYATCSFHALHAYKWLDADGGERWVRYHWVPEAGEASLKKDEAEERGPDYLQDEIRDRLAREPVRFTLEVQMAGDGDKVHDPTAVWPEDRERVAVGTLEVTGLETERETGGDVVVFDPGRVTDGIELSDDPILRFRSPAYSVSVERRM